ncbi:MAG: hypothetical protein CM15mV3_2940 [Caudoviricetes sp.]|nr:MAG: hypothetical protein CM15mV3_2940 [Caudoviricetes sp.]
MIKGITKSGVGLEVQVILVLPMKFYIKVFFLPSGNFPILVNPGFQRSTGNYTESIDVLPMLSSHIISHDGTRTRVRSSLNNEFASFGKTSIEENLIMCRTLVL